MQRGFGGADAMELVDVPTPTPVPTEVLIRVYAAGVNPADLGVREGPGAEFFGLRPPFRPGWDVSGVVEQIGAGVTRFAVGDEVFGLALFPRAAGTFAQYVTAPSRQLAHKPAGVDHVSAAAVPLAGLTAWQALVDVADVRPGQRVLVHAAAGGVGHIAVQIAKARGAYVLGTASAAKHDLLRGLGVDEPIDYRAGDFSAAIDPVDVVLDLVGEDYVARSLASLRAGGTLVEIAGDVDAETATQASARGVRAVEMLVEPDGAGMAELAALLAGGRLRVTIAGTYPLDQVAAAQDSLSDGRTVGKVVLTVHH